MLYGPGSKEVAILAAKLAARAGGDAAVFAGSTAAAKRYRKLMYGAEYADNNADEPGCARVLSSTEELGASLATTQVLPSSLPLPLPSVPREKRI